MYRQNGKLKNVNKAKMRHNANRTEI